MNKVPSPWPQPSTRTSCSTHHEQGSLTLTMVLTVNKVPSPWQQYSPWTRLPHPDPHPSTQDTLQCCRGSMQQHLPWTRFPHPDRIPACGTTYSVVEAACSSTNCEQGSLTLTTVLTVNKVSSLCLHPSMWDTLQCCRGSMQQHLPWTRFPHREHSTPPWTRFPNPDRTPAHGTPCSVVEATCSSTYCEGSLTLLTP